MSFCTNCGTQLDDGAYFCTECGTPLNGQPKPQASEGVYGLGGAITSAILGFVGVIFSIVTYIMGMSVGMGNGKMEGVAIMFAMTSLALCIVSLVLGIKSIGNFKKGRALGKKPIGTLILGIGGIVLSGYGLLFALLGFAMALL